MSPEDKSRGLNVLDYLLAFFRSFSLQASWNFERYLNYGFAFVMAAVLKKIYTDPVERSQALVRHMEYFNTNPYMASFILGASVRMEREKGQMARARQKQKGDEINALKVGMMGPVAAMGDSLFWATIRPYCGLLGVVLVLTHAFPMRGQYWIVPLLFLAVYNLPHIGVRIVGFWLGLKHGDQMALTLRRFRFQEGIRGLKMASTLLLGVLIVFLNISDMDREVGLFVLKLTFFTAIVGLFTFVLHRKISPAQLFYAVVLFALMLAFWPEISAPPPIYQTILPRVPQDGVLWAMLK